MARIERIEPYGFNMVEVAAQAFFSYAHGDNEREGGRVLRLAELIGNEFETLTGTSISIFTDNAEIKWGHDFRAKLDEALQATTFFIPVLTPTYFLREECRKEMTRFVTSAQALGLEELLLSIRYSDVTDLREGSADDLKDIAARMQYESWGDLRLEDETSSEYRKAINRLAKRLVELTRDLENKPVSAEPSPSTRLEAIMLSPSGIAAEADEGTEDEDEDAPGPVDLIAELQPAMNEWSQTLHDLAPATFRFNEVVNASALKMNAANDAQNPFAAKVVLAREFAAEAEEPLAEIERLSKEYLTRLLRLDPRLRALLEMVAKSEEDPEIVSSFLESVQSMVDASLQSAASTRQAADSARDVAKLSRDIRPVFRRFETALRNVADASVIIEGWQPLLERDRA